jgi:heptosyltransferase II
MTRGLSSTTGILTISYDDRMSILVRAPNWLGDAVMATPFLKRLTARFPAEPLDVIAKLSTAAMFRGLPGVRRVWPLGSPEASPKALRRQGYDIAYILPTSFSSAWGAFLAGATERVGHAAEGRSWLLTWAVPLDERYHYTRRYLSLIGEENREASREDLFFPVENPPFPLPEGPLLAVAPGARAPARRWMPERFAELIRRLPPSWKSVVLLGAASDDPFAQIVARSAGRPTLNLCGKTSLPVLGGILNRCRALVANESGLMHAAWAVGTPLVAVAGPSEPHCTSPFGPRVRIVIHREVPCVPCVKNECFRLGDDQMACLKAVSAEEVLSALSEVSS